ncbi:hypothetical protein Tcan_08552 [Toxocara canis]|uniref:Uncharacterized protein n=1 Tax=Toxocara canis TaxID=6265 RepID=A0A0B2UM17_TOXCA|nr:hypothetical protein Tcan_08552 [Toxocara canis]
MPYRIDRPYGAGGDNIQTLFLTDKLVNLALYEAGSAHDDVKIEYFCGDRRVSASSELIAKRISESHFDDVSLDLLQLSRFLAWNPCSGVQPIDYDREKRLLRSNCGIVRVVYFASSASAHFISCFRYSAAKQLKLDIVSGSRILAIASDGNSATFAS